MLERSSVPRLPLSLPGARVLVIESPYYQDVAAAMLAGAIAEIEAAGATFEKVSVPGALEIPQALAVFMDSDASIEFDGAVALGCVIRGETSHYDIVCNNANHWLYTVANEFGMPVGNAILTVDTHEQALARASGGRAGKGGDAAYACLSLIALRRKLQSDD
jgi:6,7-dimethyl-8-ribityllumazine synthase